MASKPGNTAVLAGLPGERPRRMGPRPCLHVLVRTGPRAGRMPGPHCPSLCWRLWLPWRVGPTVNGENDGRSTSGHVWPPQRAGRKPRSLPVPPWELAPSVTTGGCGQSPTAACVGDRNSRLHMDPIHIPRRPATWRFQKLSVKYRVPPSEVLHWLTQFSDPGRARPPTPQPPRLTPAP